MRLKIFIAGSGREYAIENFYSLYLQEAGAEVFLFPAQRLFYDFYQKSIFNKLLFKAGLSAVYKNINESFKKEVERFRPDIIWVFKGMEIFASSLAWAKEKGILLVNYNPDNPFIFTGKGSGNKNVTDAVPLYDLHFTYNWEIREEIEKRYGLPTAYLPFGFELSEGLYEECRELPEINKACFLGNPDRQRAEFISLLAEEGVSLDVYGQGWGKFVRHPHVEVHGPVAYGAELWKILRKYRVQLNLMRIHNEQSHNMRTFEVPGVGGIMVAPDTVEHRQFFEDGKECFLFTDTKSCAGQIKAVIALSGGRAAEIRSAARGRSIGSGYSYKDRSMYALKEMEKLSHSKG